MPRFLWRWCWQDNLLWIGFGWEPVTPSARIGFLVGTFYILNR